MLVQIKRGRGDGGCPCGGGLKHWAKSTGLKPVRCATVKCLRTADLGARVLRAGSLDRSEYIVPLCDWCHKLEEEIEVSALLVPAGTQEFCGTVVAPAPLPGGRPNAHP